MTAFDTHARMRVGDASAWPRWRPEFLPADEVMTAWARAMKNVGKPGSPEAVRVYTHFTYCESSCDFCMYFHKVPDGESSYAKYADHLVGLVERFGESCGRTRASAAYFGGGTPSAMPPPHLSRYLAAFTRTFEVQGEFSVEAHPRSADQELIAMLSSYGVNRVSMGVQSLEPAVLRTITRRNRPLEHMADVIAAGRAANLVVNTDLCLGLPGQTLESFRADVRTLLELGPDIITVYLYQPVSRLPSERPADMTYALALDDALQETIAARGYRIGDPLDPSFVVVRLLRNDQPGRRWPPQQVYALFDDHPSHLVGFGPGSYGHIFGYGWFREATSMEALDDKPVYWGSRLSPTDEYRQMLLDAIERSIPFDRAALDSLTGVRADEAFADALEAARESGFLKPRGDLEVFDRGVASPVRDAVIERIALPPPTDDEPAQEIPPHEPALIVLRTKNGRSPNAAPELVRQWCDSLGVPARGHRFFGATVRDVDDTSVYFAVGSTKAVPLRVFVRAPGTDKNLYETARFGISYAARPEGPLSEDEKHFLTFLARRTRQADAR